MAKFSYIPNRVIDTNGISDGANIYFYTPGTTTPVTIYSDAGFATPVSNPYPVSSGAAVPALYHNESGGVRVKVVDSSGNTVSDDDPWSAFAADVVSTATGDDLQGTLDGYATRTALKAITSYAGARAFLTESGREGEFVFRSGDYSTEVTADTNEGIYVKADDTVSTSGAWVRKYSGAPDPRWFGAVGDNSTDDTSAITAIESAQGGGDLPRGKTFKTTDTAVGGHWTGQGSLVLANPARRWSPEIIKGKALTKPTAFGFTPVILPTYRGGKWAGDVSAISLAPAVTGSTYYVDGRYGSATAHAEAMTITGITQANPAVVTYTGTDPTNGNLVRISDVSGMTEVNDLWFTVANVNAGANTFELSGVDSTAYTAYSSGGTAIEPLDNIELALELSDVGLLYIAPHWYDRTINWGAAGITTTSPIRILPWTIREGRIVNSTSWDHSAAGTWTKDATYDRVYSASRSLVGRVIDTAETEFVHADGKAVPKWREYQEAASLSDCNNNPGSWFQSGSTIYVHPLNIRKDEALPTADTYNTATAEAAFAPSNTIKFLISETNAFFDDDLDLYCEGIDFVGGDEGFWFKQSAGARTKDAIFSDCGAYYASHASDGNGWRIAGGRMQIIFERCAAMFNRLDGFNYHNDATGGEPDIIEINCRSLFNGADGGGINNASSIHDALNILRIGGEYGLGDGPTIADTGGGDSWNVGCHVLPSRRIASAITKSSLYNSACSMWAYDCVVDPSETNAMAVTSSGTTYLHNTEPAGTATESGGTFAEYEQA